MISVARGFVRGRLPRSTLLFAAALALCLAADFCFARLLLPNSDSIQSYKEMLAVRSGNTLLRGWVLPTDDDVLTDGAPMLAASLLLGRGTALIFLVPFAVFATLLATSIAIVRRCTPTAPGRLAGSCAVLLLFGVPYSLHYNFFFWSDFHIATVAACLLAILAVAPALAGEPFPRWRLVPFTCLVFATAFSDPLADILLVGPVILLVLLRAWSTGVWRRDEWLVAACTALGAACGAAALHVLVRSGASFAILPNASLAFVPTAAAALRNLVAITAAEQVLFTARARLIPTLPLHELVAACRLVTAIAVAVACGAVLWRLPRSRRSGVAQLLVLGALSMTVLSTFSQTFTAAIAKGDDFPGAAVRFGVPVFVFACLAAALQAADLAPRLGFRQLLLPGACLALVHAFGAVVATVAAARSPAGIRAGPDAELAFWLQRQGYTYGVGDYWDTQLVEALTAGRVQADPVLNVGGPLQLWAWVTDTTRFGPRHRPQFAIIRPHGLFRVDLASITRTYGAPVSITLVADQFYVAKLDVAKLAR